MSARERGDFPDHLSAICTHLLLFLQGSGVTCQLLAESTYEIPRMSLIVFQRWKKGLRRRRPGPRKPSDSQLPGGPMSSSAQLTWGCPLPTSRWGVRIPGVCARGNGRPIWPRPQPRWLFGATGRCLSGGFLILAFALSSPLKKKKNVEHTISCWPFTPEDFCL